MLSIIVTIGKILGIILLVILGILLFVLFAVLFVPVRYRAEGYYRETYAIKARVTWFFHLLSVFLTVENQQELHMAVKVFGISVFDNKKRKPEICSAEIQEQKPVKEKKEKKKEKTKGAQEQVNRNASVNTKEDTNRKTDDRTADEVPVNKGEINRIREIFKRIINAFRNIQYTFEKMCAKIKYVKGNISYYLSLLQSETTKQAFALCQKQLKRIFRNLKPQKYTVNLRIGMDDPATLGQILGIWGMLYPLHQGNVDIDANFEEQMLEGDFFLKGRISVYVYVWTVCLVLFDKDIKQLRRCFKREEKMHG